jgi:hypothetical protein
MLVEQEENSKYKKGIEELFYGSILDIYTCQVCKSKSNVLENFWDLLVNFSEKSLIKETGNHNFISMI